MHVYNILFIDEHKLLQLKTNFVKSARSNNGRPFSWRRLCEDVNIVWAVMRQVEAIKASESARSDPTSAERGLIVATGPPLYG